uniref:Uncharacterized protein n=1 Tax=Oryza rufipogon TaxID=4529 RepID=A0A0E0QZC5_ORYRU
MVDTEVLDSLNRALALAFVGIELVLCHWKLGEDLQRVTWAGCYNHRRSCLSNDMPSSAVIIAAKPANTLGSLLLGLCLGRLPRQLVSLLQQTGSSSTAIAGVTPECGARNQILRHYNRVDHDDTASRVCSMDARAPTGGAGGSRASRCRCMLASSPPAHPPCGLEAAASTSAVDPSSSCTW